MAEKRTPHSLRLHKMTIAPTLFDSYGFGWIHVDSCEFMWIHVDSSVFICIPPLFHSNCPSPNHLTPHTLAGTRFHESDKAAQTHESLCCIMSSNSKNLLVSFDSFVTVFVENGKSTGPSSGTPKTSPKIAPTPTSAPVAAPASVAAPSAVAAPAYHKIHNQFHQQQSQQHHNEAEEEIITECIQTNVQHIVVRPRSSSAAVTMTQTVAGTNNNSNGNTQQYANNSAYGCGNRMYGSANRNNNATNSNNYISSRTTVTVNIVALVMAALFIIVVAIVMLPVVLEKTIPILSAIQPTTNVAIGCVLLIVLTTSPCAVGYGFIMLGTAFIFKWASFFIIYGASVLGGCIWFTLTRVIAHKYGITPNSMLSRFPFLRLRLMAVQRAVATNGFKVGTLLQLTFLPYGVVTAVLGMYKVTLLEFFMSAAISRLKIITYVWLAMSVDDLRLLFSRNRPIEFSDYARFLIAISFSIAALVAVSWLAKKHLLELEHESLLGSDEEFLDPNVSIPGSLPVTGSISAKRLMPPLSSVRIFDAVGREHE